MNIYAIRKEEFLKRRVQAQNNYIALIEKGVFNHNLNKAVGVLEVIRARLAMVAIMNEMERLKIVHL